jgi:hypothetical protein
VSCRIANVSKPVVLSSLCAVPSSNTQTRTHTDTHVRKRGSIVAWHGMAWHGICLVGGGSRHFALNATATLPTCFTKQSPCPSKQRASSRTYLQ